MLADARGASDLREVQAARYSRRPVETGFFEPCSLHPASSILPTAMQTYDLLMLLVLVATTVFGFWKGMAWQVASLASLGVSYIASLKFSEQLAPVFCEHAPWN